MSRPPVFDLDELLAFAESGEYRTAPQLMEAMGIPGQHLRAVQKALNRYVGPRPRRLPALRKDPLRRRVIDWMKHQGINPLQCSVCSRITTLPMYFREVKPDDELGSLRLVCRNCRKGGDF